MRETIVWRRVPLVLLFSAVVAACAPAPAAPAVTSVPAAQPTTAPAAKPTEAPRPAVAASPAAQPTAAAKPAASGPAAEVRYVTDFGIWGGNTAPLYAGIKQGFFKEQNINLTVLPGVGSTDTAGKIATGAADFGSVDTIALAVTIGQGAPLKMVAAQFQKHVGGLCYIQGRKEIKSYKDLQGAKVGAAAGDAYMVFLPQLMRNAGLPADAYQTVTMAAANTGPAMIKGDIDSTPCGAITLPGRIDSGKQAGVNVGFFSFGESGFDALGLTLVTHNDTVKNKPDLVQRFVDAYAKSLKYAREQPDAAVSAMVEANKEKTKETELASWNLALPFQYDPSVAGKVGRLYIPPDRLKASVELANQAYNQNVKPEDVYTNAFVEKIPEALRQP